MIGAVAACAGLCEYAGAAEAASQPTTPVDIGTMADFPKDGVFDKFAKSDKFFVIRHEGKIYATTATCSHRKANLKLKDGTITCPNHGSRFTPQGTPTKGPAKISLMRYGISKNAEGHMIVDRSKQFEEKKWDDEGASLKV